MSYILDALRRSQAERERDRERGQVPGLHARPSLDEPALPPRRGVPLGWTVAAIAGVALLAGYGALLTREQPPLAQAPPPLVQAAPPMTQAQPPVAPPPLPQVVSVPPPAGVVPPPLAAPPRRSAASSPAAPRPLRLAELSAEQRLDLPPLVAGGSVWSDNAGSRFVIINGQVVREGEQAATGVTLERIAPKAAVLRWRELRIELPL